MRWLTLAVAMVAAVGATTMYEGIAQAGTSSSIVAPAVVHTIAPRALPSVMPHKGVTPTPSPTPTASAVYANAASAPYFHIDKSLRLPASVRVPKLSKFLVGDHKGHFRVAPMPAVGQAALLARLQADTKAHYHTLAANGSTIILTGDSTNVLENDQTLGYGEIVYPDCEQMPKTNYNNYEFVVWPPDGSGPYVSQTEGTNGAGDCTTTTLSFNLSTPFTGWVNYATIPAVGSAPAYPGVWVMAMYDKTSGQYINETNIIAEAAVNFTTYSDLGEANQTADYAPGSLMVVGASGLNPNHSYALGWVYTAGNNLPCAYSIPAAAALNAVCFKGAETGIQALGGNLEQWWGPSSSPSTTTAATGTYDVELYDTTSSDMVGHQQISVEPSSVSWTLTPVNSSGATPPPGFNYNNIFATDGLTDQSVTGLTYAVTGLPAGDSGNNERLSISDPNGVILTANTGWPSLGASPTSNQAGTSNTFTNIAFPLNSTYFTALGPTQTPFAPNVLTAQLYNIGAGAVLGSQSFTLLGYGATASWNSATILNGSPTGVTATLTITNTAGSSFGTWNGDSISGVKISADTGGESIALSSTTAVDSANNPWTITQTGTGATAVITATTNQRNVGIPPGGTLQFNIIVTVPTGKCNTAPCSLPTQILPEHGIAFSGTDTASNPLEVLAAGVNQSTVTPTYTWKVTGETGTANMAARDTIYPQLTYESGTANSPTTDSYNLNFTVNNLSSPGNAKMMDVKITLPSSVDVNETAPTLNSSPTGDGTWKIETFSNNAALLTPNVFEITCSPTSLNQCGIPVGANGTFSIKMPIFGASFVTQSIPAVANFDGGGCGGGCNATSYSLNPTSTTVNGIAGLSNINSTELGSFSLNPSLMNVAFSPNTVGTGAATSATFSFTNTSTVNDVNPDYVDQINLIFPAAANPASITVPSPWVATQTSADHWTIAFCAAPTNATPCADSEPNALAPGANLQMTMNYNSPGPTAGTYSVTWYATGANGGENTSAIVTTTPITFSNTTASFAITAINGAPVSSGSEPQVGTDTVISDATHPWTDKGSAYQFTIGNTGTTTLTEIQVTVPHLTRSSTAGTDNSGGGALGDTNNNGYFDITSVSAAFAGGASCSTGPTIVQPTATADGTITYTGCTIPPSKSVVLTANLQTPYLVGNEFQFNATVYQGASSFTAIPTYSGANVVSVVLNGTLSIITPAAGWVAPTQPNSLAPYVIDNTLTPATNCVSCQVTTGSPNLIDFGVFNGTFSSTDLVDASVLSDANSISGNSWKLYVTTSPGTNPSNMLSTDVDSAKSSAKLSVLQSTLTPVLTTSPGLALSTYSATPYHGPLDSIMNYQIATGGNTSAESVTLTFTLVFN